MTTELRADSRATASEVAIRSLKVLEGEPDLEACRTAYHAQFVNREAATEPPACRRSGPGAAYATAVWLHNLACDIHWEVHEVVCDGDLVAVHCTMNGHQSGEHVQYDGEGNPAQTMPNLARPFAVTQTHWLRVRDGLVIEHWANRDDLAMAMQLGWLGH